MKTEDRKAAIAAYKKRESPAGIYAIRCMASGEIWVGQTPDLDKIQNRVAFTLAHGGHSNRGLQETWLRYGNDAFGFEVLERLEAEESDYIRRAVLKERCSHWRQRLMAHLI